MEVEYADEELEDLEFNTRPKGNYSIPIEKAFRKRVGAIRAASNTLDLYKYRGNKFEKLAGDRQGQHSLILTGNYRLIVEVIETESKEKIKIIEIVDYH